MRDYTAWEYSVSVGLSVIILEFSSRMHAVPQKQREPVRRKSMSVSVIIFIRRLRLEQS